MDPIRRCLMLLPLLAAASPAAGQIRPNQSSPAADGTVSVAEAHRLARSRQAVLLDIRTPQEWQSTGIPESAHAISVHQQARSFLQALEGATGGDKTRTVILICATGSRSSNLRGQLVRLGYTSVLDAGEGMLGSARGAGWARSGLPVRPAMSGASPKLD